MWGIVFQKHLVDLSFDPLTVSLIKDCNLLNNWLSLVSDVIFLITLVFCYIFMLLHAIHYHIYTTVEEQQPVQCEEAYLTCKVPGDVSTLVWTALETPLANKQSSDQLAPPTGGKAPPTEAKTLPIGMQLPIKVFYTALNVQDKALVETTDHGKLALEHPGIEFSGISGNGRRVMGLVQKGKVSA